MKLKNRILATLLASACVFAGMAPAAAVAQTTATAPAFVKGNLATFVVYHNAAGDAACRVATPEESRRILDARRGEGGDSLHLIYSGAPLTRTEAGVVESYSAAGSSAGTSAATGPLPALLPSAGLHIFLHGTSQLEANPDAKNAFIVAANRWEAVISTPINVVIDVDYGTTAFGDPFPDSNILGQTGSRQVSTAFSNVRQRLIANSPTSAELQLYNALPASTVPVETSGGASATLSNVVLTRANARALGLIANVTNPGSVAPGSGDASMGFNSAFGFDFNPDDGISAGKTDFDAVVTHEIGHALGFVSDSGGDAPTALSIWDVFRFRPGAASLSTMATARRVMAAGGTQVFFDAQNHSVTSSTGTTTTQELGLSTGGPKGDADGGDGNQSSHWKDDFLVAGRPYVGIMDPTIGSGVRRLMTDNDTNALNAFGYAVGGTVPPPPPPPAAPANDNFANAVTLQGPSGTVNGTNVSATLQAGEPTHADFPGGASVWYSWTAPATGTAVFDTVGSSYDTTLAAYTGSSLTGLTKLVENDDIDTDNGVVNSRVSFPATAGTTYRIQVEGYNGDTGSVVLNWSGATAPPASFNLSGRVVDASGNPVAGVRIALDGPALTNTFPALPDTTDSNGVYGWSLLTGGGNYTVRPEDARYVFTPSSVVISNISADRTNVNFTVVKVNQIDDPTFFVTQHYRDFLNREPDASGLAFWVGQITSCNGNAGCIEAKRINVSAAFFLSIEFQNTGYLVERMYKTAYGDATETSTGLVVPIIRRSEFLADIPVISNGVIVGQGDWQAQLETNKTAFATAFVQRTRFTDAYPLSMTPTEFVTKLNQKAGGVLSQARVGEIAAEMAANIASSNVTAARAVALRRVAESGELDKVEKNRAFVLMEYYGYLRRNPNDAPEANLNYAGWSFWLTKLNQFGGDFVKAEMVKAFLDSSEYRNRFAQ